MRNENIETTKLALEHCRFIWDKIKLNQETSDRHFNYFLLFLTTPIAIIGLLRTYGAPNPNVLPGIEVNLEVINLISIVLFLAGTSFFLSSVVFRTHRIRYVLEISHIENTLIAQKLYGGRLIDITGWSRRKRNIFNKFGGDFWLNSFQATINGFWLAVFVCIPGTQIIMFLLVLFATIAGLMTIRHLMLAGDERLGIIPKRGQN